jgi:hypothetical protein
VTYSVVSTGDERGEIFSIIQTLPDGGQQVIAFQVTPGYADKIASFLNIVNGDEQVATRIIEFYRLLAKGILDVDLVSYLTRDFCNHLISSDPKLSTVQEQR